MSYVYDGLAILADLIHVAVIVFAAIGGAFGRYRHPKVRWAHYGTLLMISIGMVLMNGRCWLTEVAIWLRQKAHPEPAEEVVETFAVKVSDGIGMPHVLLLSACLLIFVGCTIVGAIRDGNDIKRTGRV